MVQSAAKNINVVISQFGETASGNPSRRPLSYLLLYLQHFSSSLCLTMYVFQHILDFIEHNIECNLTST